MLRKRHGQDASHPVLADDLLSDVRQRHRQVLAALKTRTGHHNGTQRISKDPGRVLTRFW